MTAGPIAALITPHGRLLLAPDQDAPVLAEALRQRLEQTFARGVEHGLLQLGAGEVAARTGR